MWRESSERKNMYSHFVKQLYPKFKTNWELFLSVQILWAWSKEYILPLVYRGRIRGRTHNPINSVEPKQRSLWGECGVWKDSRWSKAVTTFWGPWTNHWISVILGNIKSSAKMSQRSILNTVVSCRGSYWFLKLPYRVYYVYQLKSG